MHQLQRLESELADQRRQIRQLQAESDHWKARTESAANAPPPAPLPPMSWWPPAFGSYPPYAWTDYGVGSGPQPSYDAATTAGVTPWAAVPPVAASTTPRERPPEPHRTFQKDRDFRQRRPLASDTCKSCGLKGHWAWDCPSCDQPATATNTTGGSTEPTPTAAAINEARVTGVSASISGAETYLEINVKGIKALCLVDSGCDHSVLPRKKELRMSLCHRLKCSFSRLMVHKYQSLVKLGWGLRLTTAMSRYMLIFWSQIVLTNVF